MNELLRAANRLCWAWLDRGGNPTKARAGGPIRQYVFLGVTPDDLEVVAFLTELEDQ